MIEDVEFKNILIDTVPNDCITNNLINNIENFIIVFQNIQILKMFVMTHNIHDTILICHKTEIEEEENFICNKNTMKEINNFKILITCEGLLKHYKILQNLYKSIDRIIFNFIDNDIINDKRFDDIKNKTKKIIIINENKNDNHNLNNFKHLSFDHEKLINKNILNKIKIFNFEPKNKKDENIEITELITKIANGICAKKILMILDNIDIDEIITKYKIAEDEHNNKVYTFKKNIIDDNNIKNKISFVIVCKNDIKESYFESVNICYITSGCININKCIGYMSNNSNNIIITHKDNNIHDIVNTNFISDRILGNKYSELSYIDKFKKNYDTFNEKYDKLITWIKKNGKMPSYYSKDNEEKKLASWCAYKKREKRLGKIDDEIIDLLEKINGWNWGTSKFAFEDRLAELKEWSDAHNNKIPSYISKNRKEKKLAIWCNTMRQEKKKNKLSQTKIEELEKIKNWFWVGDMKNFEETLKQLKEWIGKNKTFPSLTSKEQEEKYLAKWCSNKRNAKNKGTLSVDHIKKLEEIKEWKWGTTFNDMIQTYDKWTKEHEKIPSQSSKNLLEKKLAIWRNARCQEKKKGKLTDAKISALNALSMWKW